MFFVFVDGKRATAPLIPELAVLVARIWSSYGHEVQAVPADSPIGRRLAGL